MPASITFVQKQLLDVERILEAQASLLSTNTIEAIVMLHMQNRPSTEKQHMLSEWSESNFNINDKFSIRNMIKQFQINITICRNYNTNAIIQFLSTNLNSIKRYFSKFYRILLKKFKNTDLEL